MTASCSASSTKPFPEYRIPRKQYTRIFSAFVDEQNVLALRDAMNYCRKHRAELLALASDSTVGFVVRQLADLESSLDASKRNYFKGAWQYVSHKWRRRGVVSAENVLASIMEGVGRVASEIVERKNKKVTRLRCSRRSLNSCNRAMSSLHATQKH